MFMSLIYTLDHLPALKPPSFHIITFIREITINKNTRTNFEDESYLACFSGRLVCHQPSRTNSTSTILVDDLYITSLQD